LKFSSCFISQINRHLPKFHFELSNRRCYQANCYWVAFKELDLNYFEIIQARLESRARGPLIVGGYIGNIVTS